METRVTLITCSFRGDFEMCRLLCRSIDRFAAQGFLHRVYVPGRDLGLFAALAAPWREILSEDALLPRWLIKAPLPGPKWRARLGLTRRNVYLSPFHGLVRGWIVQQIMKLEASLRAGTEIVTHIDSDAALIAPLRPERFFEGRYVRLYAAPPQERPPGHALWYEAAANLLGLPERDYFERDYIAPLVVWRRSVVEAMTKQMAAVAGRDWRRAVAGCPHFSEYTLYGVFAEFAAGLEPAGLMAESHMLALTRWTGAFADAADEAAFAKSANVGDVLCCVQSTIPLGPEARARIYEAAERAVAAKLTLAA